MRKMISMTVLGLAIGGLGAGAWAAPRANVAAKTVAEKTPTKKKKKVSGSKRVRKHAPAAFDKLPNS